MFIPDLKPGFNSSNKKIGCSSFLVATYVTTNLLKIMGVACEIRDPGVKQALGIPDPDPQHCKGLDL
jgi:hypothetical protein